MKTLKILRLIAAALAEVFIIIAFVDMYRRTQAGALFLLMVFFLSAVPFILAESRKKGTRSELIRAFFFLGVFYALDSYILYKFRKSIS